MLKLYGFTIPLPRLCIVTIRTSLSTNAMRFQMFVVQLTRNRLRLVSGIAQVCLERQMRRGLFVCEFARKIPSYSVIFQEKATECVHIKHSTSQITVPRGSSHQISFGVAHLDRLPKLQTYSCRIRLSGTEIVSAAVLSEVMTS